LISTAVLAFIYQRFGSKELLHQIAEMRRSLVIAQRGLDLGLRDMWRERRHVPRLNTQHNMWNSFSKAGRSEVWLLGIAEFGFATDPDFAEIVSEGTAQGCCFRFLLLDPTSVAASEIDVKEGGGQQVQGRIRRALYSFLGMQKNNVGKRGSVEVRLYSDTPRVSIVRSDNELLVTPYMPPLRGEDCFTFHVQEVSKGVFNQYLRHFENIWENAQKPPVLVE